MDTVDKQTRSRIMSRTGQKNTDPEMKREMMSHEFNFLTDSKAAHKVGLRYRLHNKRTQFEEDLRTRQNSVSSRQNS